MYFRCFFLPNEIFIIIFDFVAVFLYLQGLMIFKSLQKIKLWLKFDSTHSFEKGLFDISILFWYILFVMLPTKLKENTK